MKDLPPIPIPASVRLREIRMVMLPVMVFVVTLSTIVILWRHTSLNWSSTGVGEGLRSVVSSPQPAVVQTLLVEPYRLVQRGDPLAVIIPSDPRTQIDLLRSQLEIARMKIQPSIAQENSMNFERIRIELLKTKSELAIAREKLALAERDLKRNTPLLKEKLVSEDVYDLSLMNRDMYKAEVAEKSKAAAEIEERLGALSQFGDPLAGGQEGMTFSLTEELQDAQASAASNTAPITLLAPITGLVGVIQRQPGEFVAAGEPLLIINSLWSDRVVGYLRQPYTIDPEVGMPVLVSTRTRRKQEFWTQITQVGAQVEVLTNSVALVRPGILVDAALPIMIGLPPEARIRPGETVDLLIRPDRAGAPEGASGLELTRPVADRVQAN